MRASGSVLFKEKNFECFEICGVFARTREKGIESSAFIFRTRGKGNKFFAIMYGRLL